MLKSPVPPPTLEFQAPRPSPTMQHTVKVKTVAEIRAGRPTVRERANERLGAALDSKRSVWNMGLKTMPTMTYNDNDSGETGFRLYEFLSHSRLDHSAPSRGHPA